LAFCVRYADDLKTEKLTAQLRSLAALTICGTQKIIIKSGKRRGELKLVWLFGDLHVQFLKYCMWKTGGGA
jgi:hypothetical protein